MRLTLWIVLSSVALVTSGLYMQHVLGPWQHYNNVEIGRVRTEMGDLYPRWVGTRALLLEHKNPYGPEVSHEIQMAFYGRPIVQSYDQPAGKIIDEQRFAYPIYVVFLLAPTMRFPFAALQIWAVPALMILTALSILFWAQVVNWKPGWPILMATIFFVLATPQLVQGLRLRQLGLLVSCLVAIATWCVARNHLATAGALLAISTIKPQMVLFPITWLVIWAFGNVRGRWRLLAGFGFVLVALVAWGELLQPGWIRDFAMGMAAYSKYVQFPSLFQVLLGRTLGRVAAIALVLGLLLLAWKNRQQEGDSIGFISTLSAFLVGAALALPLLPPFNQVLLLMLVLVILRDWKAVPRLLRAAFAVAISWPWIIEITLLIFSPNARSTSRLPLLPSSLVLLTPFLLAIVAVGRRIPATAELWSR
jgi:hypothetical protein